MSTTKQPQLQWQRHWQLQWQLSKSDSNSDTTATTTVIAATMTVTVTVKVSETATPTTTTTTMAATPDRTHLLNSQPMTGYRYFYPREGDVWACDVICRFFRSKPCTACHQCRCGRRFCPPNMANCVRTTSNNALFWILLQHTLISHYGGISSGRLSLDVATPL